MKKLALLLGLLVIGIQAEAQLRYMTRNGKIVFNADSEAEKIEATNVSGTSVIDATSGKIEFAVLMKAFTFEKALMQEHFNENYVESDKYPKSLFKGVMLDPASFKAEKDGVYPVKVKGTLDLHGVTREINTDVTLTVKDGKISAKTKFQILCSDYKIKIPDLVKDKVSNLVTITLEANYSKM